MDPCGFHKSISPLLVSALQAGGSSDCGHTARLPVWMNCSKVMSCTKSLPGIKAQQILFHDSRARNAAAGAQTLAHLRGVLWHIWCPMQQEQRWCWLIIPKPLEMNTHPLTFPPSNPLNTVYSLCALTTSSQSVPSLSFTFLFKLPLNYWALSFKGTSSSYQMCGPSSLLHRSFTRSCSRPDVATWHWGNHSHVPHLLFSHSDAGSHSIFSQAPTLLTPALNIPILPSGFLNFFPSTRPPFTPLSLRLVLCFSVMSRPTAGCHWVDGGKKWKTGAREWLDRSVCVRGQACVRDVKRVRGRGKSETDWEAVRQTLCLWGCLV